MWVEIKGDSEWIEVFTSIWNEKQGLSVASGEGNWVAGSSGKG